MRDDTRPAHCTFSLLLLCCTILCVSVPVCVWFFYHVLGRTERTALYIWVGRLQAQHGTALVDACVFYVQHMYGYLVFDTIVKRRNIIIQN